MIAVKVSDLVEFLVYPTSYGVGVGMSSARTSIHVPTGDTNNQDNKVFAPYQHIRTLVDKTGLKYAGHFTVYKGNKQYFMVRYQAKLLDRLLGRELQTVIRSLESLASE